MRTVATALLFSGLAATAGCGTGQTGGNRMQMWPADDETVVQIRSIQRLGPAEDSYGTNMVRCHLLLRSVSRKRFTHEVPIYVWRGGATGASRLIGDRWLWISGIDDFTVRVDSSGDRFWVVDRGLGRVIGGIDRSNNESFGIDDSIPAWAVLEGGRELTPTFGPSRRPEEPAGDVEPGSTDSLAIELGPQIDPWGVPPTRRL